VVTRCSPTDRRVRSLGEAIDGTRVRALSSAWIGWPGCQSQEQKPVTNNRLPGLPSDGGGEGAPELTTWKEQREVADPEAGVAGVRLNGRERREGREGREVRPERRS